MVENVGRINVIYTVESIPDNEEEAQVTYWLENGQKIGMMNVKRGDG